MIGPVAFVSFVVAIRCISIDFAIRHFVHCAVEGTPELMQSRVPVLSDVHFLVNAGIALLRFNADVWHTNSTRPAGFTDSRRF